VSAIATSAPALAGQLGRAAELAAGRADQHHADGSGINGRLTHDLGERDAQRVVDQHDFAAGDQAIVDEDVDRLADAAIELDHGARGQVEQLADRHAGTAKHCLDLDRHVVDGLEALGAAGARLAPGSARNPRTRGGLLVAVVGGMMSWGSMYPWSFLCVHPLADHRGRLGRARMDRVPDALEGGEFDAAVDLGERDLLIEQRLVGVHRFELLHRFGVTVRGALGECEHLGRLGGELGSLRLPSSAAGAAKPILGLSMRSAISPTTPITTSWSRPQIRSIGSSREAALLVGEAVVGGEAHALDDDAVAALDIDADGVLDQALEALDLRLGQALGAAIDHHRDAEARDLARRAQRDRLGRAVVVGLVFGSLVAAPTGARLPGGTGGLGLRVGKLVGDRGGLRTGIVLAVLLAGLDADLVRDHLLVGIEDVGFLAGLVAVDLGGDFGADLALADDRLEQGFDFLAELGLDRLLALVGIAGTRRTGIAGTGEQRAGLVDDRDGVGRKLGNRGGDEVADRGDRLGADMRPWS
jgi:hypothetical protein